jgi:drug/metabolite transporter (DMT)-like permease
MALGPRVVAWISLAVAVLAMSSGGIWFALLTDTPAALKAAWRLILTSAIQFPGLVVQYRRADPALRSRWRGSLALMSVTGVFLAVHFVAWSASIGLTTLAHSLLFVSTTPLIMVAWMGVRSSIARRCARGRVQLVDGVSSDAGAGGVGAGKVASVGEGPHEHKQGTTESNGEGMPDTSAVSVEAADSGAPDAVSPRSPTPLSSSSIPAPAPAPAPPQGDSMRERLARLWDPAHALPPTHLEVLGSVLGFVGAAVLILSAGESSALQEEKGVSVAGDLLAFVGAAAVWIYLEVGGSLRKWMPLFLYAFPVTFTAGLAAAAMSLALEPSTTWGGLGPASLFGWLGDGQRFGLTFGAAFASGILGHTLANSALQELNPLVVSVCILWEPLIGSILGWAVGVQGVPGAATLVAGPILIVGAAVTTIGARDSKWDANRVFDAWCSRLWPGRRAGTERVPDW